MHLDDYAQKKKDYILAIRIYEEMKTVTDKVVACGTILNNNKFFEKEDNKKLQQKLTMALSYCKEIEDILYQLELDKVKELLKELVSISKKPNEKPNE